jgi:hypothetical protein
MELSAPIALPPGKEAAVPLGLDVGCPKSQSGHYEVEKNLLLLPGIEPQLFSP